MPDPTLNYKANFDAFHKSLQNVSRAIAVVSKRVRDRKLAKVGLSTSYAPRPFVGSVDISHKKHGV